MNRNLAFPLAAGLALGLALPATGWAGAAEIFAANHSDPILIRIVNGRNGQPLGPLHLTLIGGYDRQDMRAQFYREEVITDAHGEVRLSGQLENLPWLQVWVGRKKLCQRKPRSARFSVGLIRRFGLSTPNLCGLVTVEDTPGVFTVFVKGRRGRPARVHAAPALDSAPASAKKQAAQAGAVLCLPAKKTT